MTVKYQVLDECEPGFQWKKPAIWFWPDHNAMMAVVDGQAISECNDVTAWGGEQECRRRMENMVKLHDSKKYR